MKTRLLGLIVMLMALLPVSTGVADGSVEETLQFARKLERDRDYYRAITEYKRAIFITQKKDPENHRVAHLGVARCYHAGKKWAASEAAAATALKLTGWSQRDRQELTVARALALWNLGRVSEAKEMLESVGTDLKKAEKLLQAWITFAAGDLEQSRQLFVTSEYAPAVAALKSWPPEKLSPTTAGVLSAVVPGAGQLYAGKPKAAAE